jgi:hypothetical protein
MVRVREDDVEFIGDGGGKRFRGSLAQFSAIVKFRTAGPGLGRLGPGVPQQKQTHVISMMSSGLHPGLRPQGLRDKSQQSNLLA